MILPACDMGIVKKVDGVFQKKNLVYLGNYGFHLAGTLGDGGEWKDIWNVSYTTVYTGKMYILEVKHICIWCQRIFHKFWHLSDIRNSLKGEIQFAI